MYYSHSTNAIYDVFLKNGMQISLCGHYFPETPAPPICCSLTVAVTINKKLVKNREELLPAN
jgi:hypothetical protein